MNKQCYGWVVSAVRGALVVVGEHVKRSHGFSGASSASNLSGASNVSSASSISNHHPSTYISKRGFIALSASFAASLCIPLTAHAQIIPNRAAPAAQQALVINATNGVPVVNIQTPNAAGLSHNRYTQFDVNPQGVILNNAQDAVQTNLAGWVMGNAMVAGKPAGVILNEVNSPNPSQLLGAIEVAGQKAQVIVANPAGITCNGCGFINATRATLTTGEPRINSVGNLENYRVTRGQVRIDGLGMDTSTASYTDVMARAVQINAALWAQYLRITTGVNEVNAQNTQATPIDVSAGDANDNSANPANQNNPANPSPPQPPSFALDVAAIGGMYAQKIYLVGTEAGVGVRNAGLIGPYAGLGGAEIVLHANGLIENRGRIYSDHIALQAKSIVNANPEVAAPVIAATERLDIAADIIKNSEHALMVSLGDIAIGGQLDSQHHATGRAALLENASATIEAQGQLTIAANEIRNTNEHFSSDVVQVSQEKIVEFGGAGAPERYREGADGVSIISLDIDKLRTPVGTYEEWSRYEYQRIVDETRVTHTDPAKIIAGGDIHIVGDTLVNYKSQIVAGGQLRSELTQLINRDAEGVRNVFDKGIVTSHWRDRQKGRDNTGSRTVAYEPVKSSFGISLKAVTYEENAPAQVAQLSSTGGSSGNGGSGGVSVENNALFRVAPQVTSTTVIETDPAFTNRRQWLSSAYLLAQLSVDPTTVQKRLGDGFYEQRLVREQVAQLTGRRFLEGYASDEAQYQALLNNAATVATTFQLRPGVALTADQVKALTSDIVWLVEKDITLPNGEHTRALVPELYAKVRPGDLQANGALLSGRDVTLTTTHNLTNSGQIIAGKSIALAGNNVRNIGGQVSAKTVTIDAATDIDNIGGKLQARDALVLRAARDINIVSTTHTNENANSRRTTVDRVASLTVNNSESDGAGVLVAVAGRDLNLTAAAIVNDAKTSSTNTANSATTNLIAGNNVNLTTVTEDSANHIVWDRKNQRRDSQRTDIGTQIHTQGDVQIVSGNDVTLKAATVHSEQGAVNIMADRNVVVAAGRSERHVDEVHQHTEHGMVSSTTRRQRDVVNEQAAIASTVSGQTAALQAGNDVRVTGSQVISTAGTSLEAGNNVVIEAATNTRDVTHTFQQKTSGLMSSGGFGVTLGQRKQSDNTNINSVEAAASTIASVQGNVEVHAGHSVRQTGSHILAPAGDVTVTGERVEITEARDITRSQTDTTFEQTGLTVAVTNPVISAVQLAQHMSQAASNTSDPRMQTLAAASTALAAVNAAQALQAGQGQTINGKSNQIVTATDAQGNPTATKDANAADKLGGITVSVSLGSSKSQSHSTQTADQAKGSSIAAGGDVTIVAQGAGKDKNNKSDILIQGSKVTAGGAVVLKADDQLTLQAAANTANQKSSNSSQSMSVGVGFELGAKGGAGVTVAGSLGRGKANGQDLSWEETKINAGREVALTSGSDTQLNGAVVTAPKVSADVGGDLAIASLQDTSTYRNQQQSVGGSITFGPKVTGSVNFANSNIKSDYASVDQQAGLRAGDNGFKVNVQGDTSLTGGAITSTDKAVAEGKNSFTTGGQLTTSDINNQANYQADSVGVNIGVGVSPTGKYVPGGTSAGIGSDSGKSSSTTRAGISDIAGDKTARTETNQANTSVALAKIFDADKVQKEINAQVAITQAFGQLASKAVGDYSQSQLTLAKTLREQARQETDTTRASALLEQAQQLETNWGDQGSARLAAHTVIGALTGGAAGAAGAATGTLTAPLIADALAKAGVDPKLSNVLTAVGSSTLGAVAGSAAGTGGTGGTAGAASALNEVANNYLSHAEANAREKALQQKQACTTDECRQAAQKTINELNQLDTWRDAQIQTACISPSSSLCQGITSALQIAKTSYTNYDPKADINGSVAGERSQVNSQAFQYQQRVDNPFAYGVGKGLLKLSPPGLVAGAGYGAYTLTSTILENGLEATAISIAKGIVDLPYELKARLNSTDPTVRGEALVDVIALGSSTAYLTQKLGIAVVNTADQAIAKAVAKAAEETAAVKVAAQTKIDNNLYRDGGVADPSKTISPVFGAKTANELTLVEAKQLIDSRLPPGAQINEVSSVDLMNQKVLQDNPHFQKPYLPGSQAVVYTSDKSQDFLRYYTIDKDGQGQIKGWMMPATDVKGLSAEQIASKYALPEVPTHMTNVTVPPNTQIRVTVANDITIFPDKSIAGNGGGGGVQFEVLNPPPESNFKTWFTNQRKLR